MKILLLSLFACIFSNAAFAQNATVSGMVTKESAPAPGTTVTLLRAPGQKPVKFAVADSAGKYSFDNIPRGNYLVLATAIGYQKTYTDTIRVTHAGQAISIDPISLKVSNSNLDNVTVVAKRPLIEQRIDRTVVNVDASITNIGTSAMEVLEKSPGISVDRDGNISLKGKAGVLIMVDGRPTQLSGADLANLLRNMNSNQLDQIEIMTNPPARYDAAGSSGIINIKTKKAVNAGFNGSASIAYSQGRYPKTNEAFNFNYRNAKVNLFSNLSHNFQQRFSVLSIDRNIFEDNSTTVGKIFNQEANRVSTGNAYNAKLGIDFFASPKTTLGAVVNINSRKQSSENPNITNISNAAKQLQSITTALVNTESDWKSVSANLNFRRLLDKKGRELTADIDFVSHRTDNDLWMVNAYSDPFGIPTSPKDTLTGLLPQEIDVYSARVDYVQPISKTTKFEAGIKSSLVRTDNNARYDSIRNGELIFDTNRSNHFVYKENINALYANFSTSLSAKITMQLGLRLENTSATGRQKSTGDNFDRNYTQLFPTAYLQYKVDEKNTIATNFGRRVNRPSYQSLNPFIRFIDRYTYSQGNPNLKPSVSDNIEVSHSWKNMLTTTLNYSRVSDIIQEVIQQKGEEAYNMPDNVSKQDQFGIAVNLNHSIAKWWTNNMNVNLYRDRYRGRINEEAIDFAATSFVINATQQFKITKALSAEVNGRFRNGWLEGVIRVRPVGFVGAGVSYQVLKNKGTIRFSARDIFNTQRMRGRSRYGNVDFAMRQVAETQVLTIGFTYSFTKGKKIAPVKRTTGSATEEQNRIGQ